MPSLYHRSNSERSSCVLKIKTDATIAIKAGSIVSIDIRILRITNITQVGKYLEAVLQQTIFRIGIYQCIALQCDGLRVERGRIKVNILALTQSIGIYIDIKRRCY